MIPATRDPRGWRTGTSARYWEEVKAGRYTESLRLLERGRLADDPEAWYETALFHYENEDVNAASPAWEHATRLGHPVAVAWMGISKGTKHVMSLVLGCEHCGDDDAASEVWCTTYLGETGCPAALREWQRYCVERRDGRAPVLTPWPQLWPLVCAFEVTTPRAIFRRGARPDDINGAMCLLACTGYRVACYRYSDVLSRLESLGREKGKQAERISLLRSAHVQQFPAASYELARCLMPESPQDCLEGALILVDLFCGMRINNWVTGSMTWFLEKRLLYAAKHRSECARELALYGRMFWRFFEFKDRVMLLKNNGDQMHPALKVRVAILYRPPTVNLVHLEMKVYANRCKKVEAACIALFGTLRETYRFPKDIATLLAKTVWQTRILDPRPWDAIFRPCGDADDDLHGQ